MHGACNLSHVSKQRAKQFTLQILVLVLVTKMSLDPQRRDAQYRVYIELLSRKISINDRIKRIKPSSIVGTRDKSEIKTI